MGSDAASSPLAKSAVILFIILVAAVLLNLFFAHTLDWEPLGLLSFGLFCIGYAFVLTALPRKAKMRRHSEASSGPTNGLQVSERSRPLVIREERPRMAQPRNLDIRPIHALTIDLEDYFHTEVASQGVSFCDWETQPSRIEASTQRLLDLLDRNQTRATFFVLGWVAKRYPRLVQEIHRSGHEIGCHSLNHQLVCQMSPTEFMESTRTAKNLIESVVHEAVLGYRAPCFSITPGCEWAFDSLVHLGFAYDSSVHPVHHPLYGNPTAPRAAYSVAEGRLMEFPIATWKVAGRNLSVGGGAYLRLLPYQYIHRGLTAWERDLQTSAMLYLHPWEIDPYQPYIPLSVQSKIRQTWGTSTMEEKLQRLLSQFHFAPVREVHRDLLQGKGPQANKSFDCQHQEAAAQVAG